MGVEDVDFVQKSMFKTRGMNVIFGNRVVNGVLGGVG
jgi:hypothetical protein